MNLKMSVKIIHNLIRFEGLLDAYSVQIWSTFAKYVSSYRFTTTKLRKKVQNCQMTLEMKVKVTHDLIRFEDL